MWIVKGVLLGILLFIVGGIVYAGIRVGIVLHQLAQAVRAGTITHSNGGTQVDVRIWLWQLGHSPVFWAALLAAIAIGLWIMRARTTTA